MNDGSRVSYIGSPTDGLEIGDEGRVLRAVSGGAHVLFRTGERKDELLFVPDRDLVINGQVCPSPSTWDDSLSDGTLVNTAARAVFDRQGPRGLLAALDEDGHLSLLAARAEEAVDSVSAAVRNDPNIAGVIAALDPEEAEVFIATATLALIREACRGG